MGQLIDHRDSTEADPEISPHKHRELSEYQTSKKQPQRSILCLCFKIEQDMQNKIM